MIDITLIGTAMLIVPLSPAGVVPPLIYMLGTPLLLLPLRQAWVAMVYAIAWSSLTLLGLELVTAPIEVVPEAVTVIAAIIFGGHTIALIGVVAVKLERSIREREGRLAFESALARCARSLLTGQDSGAIDKALAAILEAIPGEDIFVDQNFEDSVLGLCARVTNEVIRPGFEDLVSPEIWLEDDEDDHVSTTVLPYSDLPTVYASLSKGEPSLVISSELSGREREIYEEDGCKSELNIPIIVDGVWEGSIGITDYKVERHWSIDDVQALQTAAGMVGSYWERERAYRQLQQHVRSKDAFLASISHEIRTPLTAVLGYASMMSAESANLNPAVAEQVSVVFEQATEVADIVEDLLVAARADIDEVAVIEEPIDLFEQARKVLDTRTDGLRDSVEISGGGVTAWADGLRVRQILRILVNNAHRYGGDRIDLQIGSENNKATVAVSDNGSGISDVDRAEIFEPFYRAHNRTGVTEAVGLGLYVARHLARIMGGDLTYQRRADRTVFELQLPNEPVYESNPATDLPDDARELDNVEVSNALVRHDRLRDDDDVALLVDRS
jgi:signal transduction histidine kinase